MSGKESIVKKIYNTRLKVAKYDIKYGDEDLTVAADSLREGRITIKQPGEGLKVEGRIRYVGYDQWTGPAEEDPVRGINKKSRACSYGKCDV